MTIFSILAFVMSILWIKFSADTVVEILTVLGLIFYLDRQVLAFSLLAWGNCLGDMEADVAMTKKGFGEMAVAGTTAGPVFNILIG